jgi:hypothetical protein
MTAFSPSISGAPTFAAAWSKPVRKKTPDLSKASVWKSELWRHADDEPTREGAVKKLAGLLKGLLKEAEDKGLKLAPFIGVSCPGAIDADGSIEKGAQNLPGNWGKQQVQPAHQSDRADSEHSRSRHGGPDAQRRRGAGLE